MNKRLIIIAVLVFSGILSVTLPLAGCTEGEKITVEQLTDGISAAVEDMDTYQYTITQEAQGSVEIDTGTEEIESSTEISGIVDNTNQKMHMTMVTESQMSQGTSSMEMVRYIVDDMVYIKMDMTGMPEQWTSAPLTAEDWEENPVVMQIGLLEDTEMEILGSENVNGIDCWVVKLIPSLEMYSEVIGEEIEELTPEELAERVYVKQWFAKDTYYLMKAEMEWTIVDSWGSSTTKMETECSHYNEAVSIELPAEAEAATLVE